MSSLLHSLGRKGKDLAKKKMGNRDERGGVGAAPAPAAPGAESDEAAQFNIVRNPTFAEGTEGWFGLGCALSTGRFAGSVFGIAQGRKQTWQGLAQEIGDRLEVGVDHRVEAWVSIGGPAADEAKVQATLKVDKPGGGDQWVWIGSVGVSKGKWSHFAGKLRINEHTSKGMFYFEGPGEGVDILVSSVAIIPTSQPEERQQSNGGNLPQSAADQSKKTPTGHTSDLLQNAAFADGLHHWRGKNCKIYVTESLDGVRPVTGRHFAVAENRTAGYQGMEQEITVPIAESMMYSVSGQVRIRGGNVAEATVLSTLYLKKADGKDQYITLSKVQASNSQWTDLKGGFTMNTIPKKAVMYMEGPPPGVDLLLDNLSIFLPARAPPPDPPRFKDPKIGVNIIENANLENGLAGWWAMGKCHLTVRSGGPTLLGANAARSFVATPPPGLSGKYLYASNRTHVWEGPAQTLTEKIQLFNTYQISVWVATVVPPGSSAPTTPQKVNVALTIDNKWNQGGEVCIGSNWAEISGSFRLEKKPEKVIVYFQGPAPGVDVMVAGLHIFAVDRLARVPYLRERTDKVRKCDVVVRLRNTSGQPLPAGTQVSINQTKNHFPVGTCISQWNLANKGYTKFFVEQFNWAVFDNEIKWGWTEPRRGALRYAEADEMVELCNRHGILMRGHCILWETESTVQDWLKPLDAGALEEAVQNRVSDLLTRYNGHFKHYDVNNEMLHGSFYKDKLGAQFWPYLFKLAQQFDPQAVLFVNDYHVEDGRDCRASPQKYVALIRELQAGGAPVGGIGVQGHLTVPIGPTITQALDELGSVGLPIWFTEVDVESVNEHCRADDMEVLFREAYAHPSVEGFVLWGFWEGSMCRPNSHLVDSDKRVNEAGRRFMALRKEWLTNVDGVTNDHGQVVFRGFEGDYSLSIQEWGVSTPFTVKKCDGMAVVDITV